MRFALCLLLILASLSLDAQFQVGETSITFNDPARSRNINTEIRYPATTTGSNVAHATGTFPVVVIGHGFAMDSDAYQNMWATLVPKGYIVVIPRTETGFLPAPSHPNFAEDLNYMPTAMEAENLNASSIFFGHVEPRYAVGGHSMGGGATFLINPVNPLITCLYGMGSADTSPSAIANCPNINLPSLFFHGAQDGVAPAGANSQLMYDGVSSVDKAYVNITGGAHCYFANTNFLCDLGEATSSSGISISRADQQAIRDEYLCPWLDFYLKDNCQGIEDFVNLLDTDTDAVNQHTYDLIPVATASGATTFCQGGSVTLTSSKPSGNLWSDGSTGTSITVTTSGSYQLSYIDPVSGCQFDAASPTVVTVDPAVTPTFTQLGPYCQGDTPGLLQSLSFENISGTWDGPISTTTVGNFTYNFTPNPTECAVPTTMTVMVTASTQPTFTQLGPFCQGDAPGTLATTSNEGITGTWDAMLSTATVGMTTYNFTADPGQCANTASMTVMVTAQTTPTFAQLGPFCQNDIAGNLLTTSNEGITGSWDGPINTTTAGNTIYNFLPDPGQCAATTSMTITVDPSQTPTFPIYGPYCVGDTPDILPMVSLNSIGGTWDGAISTTTAGVFQFTFTPSAACDQLVTLNVMVEAPMTPVFTQLGPYCEGDTPGILQSLSTNNISGTWDAAINTSIVGNTMYTFTPNAGECANTTTMMVSVTAQVVPIFMALGPYCENDVPANLPTTSMDGILGSWDGPINTTTAGSTTYTFTPNAGQCAAQASMNVVVNSCGLPPTDVEIKVFLEGNYMDGSNMMHDMMAQAGVVPLNQPYNAAPWSFASAVTAPAIPATAVDWVMIDALVGTPQLMGTPGLTVVESQVGFLLQNGDIVDENGNPGLQFATLAHGSDYYFIVRHRNHLDVLTATPITAAASVSYDFTTSDAQAFGPEQLKPMNDGTYVMWAGDYNVDAVVQNTDYDDWFVDPSIVNKYELTDGNLDGVVQNTDYDTWFLNKAKIGALETRY